jgi:hypothetical protein
LKEESGIFSPNIKKILELSYFSQKGKVENCCMLLFGLHIVQQLSATISKPFETNLNKN